jgi:hypothetical protein
MAAGNIAKLWPCLLVLFYSIGIAPITEGQKATSKLEGMWSDPPSTTLGTFCSFMCSEAGIARLNALLDDPKNDARPFRQLQAEAKEAEREYIHARFMNVALETYPIDPVKDPGFARCEPWGVARQMFAPHQFEIRQRGTGVLEFHYGEWDSHRTIYMKPDKLPVNLQPSRMGYSVGHWEDDTLVVETSHIAANIVMWTDLDHQARHSDQLRILERYSRSDDGKVLQLTATLEDPGSLREPVVLKKMWRWAPESHIARYKVPDSQQCPEEGVRTFGSAVF